MNYLSGEFLSRIAVLSQKSDLFSEALRVDLHLNEHCLSLYHAGKKQGKVRFGLFGRDLLTVSLMRQDPAFMGQVIRFICTTLGETYDPVTGEEPGRGIHEFTDVKVRGLSTHYNAVETSLLLLIVADRYWQITADDSLIQEEEEALVAAVDYLRAHLRDGAFFEDPTRCGAERYALPATYWKDGGLPGRNDPDYPVVYTLVQAQAVAALRAVARLAEPLKIVNQTRKLALIAEKAVKRLFSDLWDEGSNYPLIAKDRKGGITGISSDALHMLAYLQKEDVPAKKLAGIVKGALQLATPYGYRTYAPGQLEYASNSYHLGSIWPFEQFFIAKGALIQEQEEILEGSLQVIRALETLGFPELVCWDGKTLTPQGCDLQLWSAAWPQAIHELLVEHCPIGGERSSLTGA
jgi:glycogen debranching enzyme